MAKLRSSSANSAPHKIFWSDDWACIRLPAAGFAVASIDYRLRGTAPLPAAIEDVKTAVRFLRAHAEEYGINPKAVAVAGESSGGYLAAFAAFAGADDGFDNKEWGSFSSAVSTAVIWYGHTMEEYDFLKYVSKGDPSVLLLHGERDMIVDIGMPTPPAKPARHRVYPSSCI